MTILCRTPLRSFPVRVRHGLARGARWTAFPVTSYWRGICEQEIEDAIREHVGLGDVCWDLGTHFGIYSLGMALRVGPTGQVAGFEPSPLAFGKCSRHFRMNKLKNAKLFNAAVSDSAQDGELILGQGEWATTCHLPYEDQMQRNEQCGEASAKRIMVPMVRLDDLVETGEIRAPNFIKIDVEGFGAKAIRGGIKAIALARPVIVMSFHSTWELDETRTALQPLGYVSDWNEALFKTALLLPT